MKWKGVRGDTDEAWAERLARPRRPRAFGIGLNKTATSSFHEAMTVLGLHSLHDGGQEVSQAVKASIDAGTPLLSNLDPRFDAFSDVGVLSRRFRLLDTMYPGSCFVLTVRPLDAWLDSRKRHVERNLRDRAAGLEHGTFLVIDEDKWRAEWVHHITRVRAYFAGRDDFLEIDITADPSWGPFCELLGVPEPDEPFPWANRDKRLHRETS